jgi:hypothetical protein
MQSLKLFRLFIFVLLVLPIQHLLRLRRRHRPWRRINSLHIQRLHLILTREHLLIPHRMMIRNGLRMPRRYLRLKSHFLFIFFLRLLYPLLLLLLPLLPTLPILLRPVRVIRLALHHLNENIAVFVERVEDV